MVSQIFTFGRTVSSRRSRTIHSRRCCSLVLAYFVLLSTLVTASGNSPEKFGATFHRPLKTLAASRNATSVRSTTPPARNGTALVGHASSINGSGRLEGSLRQLVGENVTLNGGAVITGDLLVPGTPKLLLNGSPNFGGTIQGTGNTQPTNYQVTINGNG